MIRFGIDLDGVLANFDQEVTRIAAHLYPGRLEPNYVPKDWDFEGKFSKAEWDEIWTVIKSTPDFWYNQNPYMDSIRDLQRFIGTHNPDVYFITSRVETTGDSVLVQSARFLRKFDLFPNGGRSTVIPVAHSTKKGNVLEALGLPFMLDDYDKTVAQLQSLKDTKTFVLDRAWNRHAVALPRVYSVGQYLDIVSGKL